MDQEAVVGQLEDLGCGGFPGLAASGPDGDGEAAMRKFHQQYQEHPVPKGRGSIDDFRLRGSRPCRRMGGQLSRVGWRTQVVHAFGNHNTALSEGAALAVVVEAIPGNPHWTWVGTDSPSPLR